MASTPVRLIPDPTNPDGYITWILHKKVLVFQHDLPEYEGRLPWVAQYETYQGDIPGRTDNHLQYAYGNAADKAARNLRAKQHRAGLR